MQQYEYSIIWPRSAAATTIAAPPALSGTGRGKQGGMHLVNVQNNPVFLLNVIIFPECLNSFFLQIVCDIYLKKIKLVLMSDIPNLLVW